MKRYEYKCISILVLSGKKVTRILNEYGKQGWELVWVWSSFHYLRRELKSERQGEVINNIK